MSRSFLRALPRRGKFLLALVVGAMLLPAVVLAATSSGVDEGNGSQPAALAAAGPCPDVSPLACDQVKANLPLTLPFDADRGGLLDAGGEGTGFTMVQRSSNGGQYRPANIDLQPGNGKLRINSTQGIQYRTQHQSGANNPNTLDNGLGVGLDATKKLRLETTVLNTAAPAGSTNSEQSGLWFGPNEDNYVKLVVTGIGGGGHKIQLVREVEGFFGATEEVNSASLGNLSTQTVQLSLLTDPASGEISALYKLGSGAETVLGKLTVPAYFFNGTYPGADTGTVKQPAFPAAVRDLGSTGFGGIFATSRNNTASLAFDFGEFTVADLTPAASPNMEVTPERFVLNQPTGDGAGPAKTVTIRNTGDGPLHMGQLTLEGAGASQFTIVDQPDATLAPNGSTTAQVAFDPSSTGVKVSELVVPGDDPDAPQARVQLRGLGTAGTGGSNEPSLQRVLDVNGITVNVGDDNPDTNLFHSVPATQKAQLVGPDELRVQRFEKAGTGPVTVETLAVFGPTDANPVVRVGRHLPGDAAQKTELLSVPNAPLRNGQTVDVPNGTTSFDPADNLFALYSEWPYFQNRVLSQEDARNTFSGAFPHHVRVYPYRTAAGATPNAYVLATEETLTGPDFQDVVLLVRNVRPSALSSGKIAVENMDGVPFSDRLVFNRIQTPDAANPNGVHDQATLRIKNTSAVEPLTVTGLDLPAGFELVNPPALPRAIPANGSVDVTVKFTATTPAGNPANRLFEGNLTVRSSDADQPATPIELAGMWQRQSEGGTEPDVAQIADAFGYGTTILNSGQTLNSAGELVKVGDEVHSKYWRRGDTAQPVKVRQLGAFHTQGNTATFFTTLKATSTAVPASTTRLVHRGVDGQSFLPRINGTTCPGGATPTNQRAECSFTPGTGDTGTTTGTDAADGTFGLRIDPEYSDWTVNRTGGGIDGPCLDRQQTNPSVVCGHHLRTWPVKDRAGKLVKDKWLAVMDYAGINYDFNDNVYLVENVKPEDPAVDPNVLQPCTPIACDKVKVGLPFELDFGSARAQTVEDKDGQGTGFTSVDKPTNTSTGAKGYIKENLDLEGGALRITTTKGLQFSGTTNNPDSQDNMLGAGIDWGTAPKPASIGTTLLAPPVGSANFEQAGPWFGRDGDSYAKLVLISDTDGPRVQFLKEQERQHDSTNDQCKSDVLALAGKDLQLKVDADPVTRRVTASYRLAGGAEIALPCSFTVPASWFNQDPAAIDERIGTSSFAGVFASHRNATNPATYSFGDFAVREQASRPRVTAMRPADGATDVVRDVAVATDLQLPNGSIDNATVTAQSVRLVKASDGQPVAGTRGTSGGGDTVTFTPSADLEANTAYRFEVSDQLHDLSGASFVPFAGTFTTGTRLTDDGSGESTAAFTKVTLPTATAPQYHGFTSLAFGPDGKLYGARNDGQIRRFAVNADGTLGDPELIDSLTQKEGGSRLLIGMRFDPSSTPSNPVAWVSHTTYGFDGMPDWGGKITRLSGANLQNVQDYVIGLPRSARDHVTNGIDIGPDGALYFTQGSNSAMGREDSSWGNRPERLLNAAVLRLDPTKVGSTPLNVQTEGGGSYNPFAAGAPLTIFASGVRNAFDLAWHSNGQLYVPTNGSAAGGNTPATPSPLPASCQKRLDGGTFTGPSAPALSGVSQTQHDFLFRAVQGGYYGHPNATRCEWALNGGNPTAAADPGQVDAYPVGTQPDPNWRGAAFDFGLNKSPNGVTEYRNASVFGGSLAGKLLVLRYSNNDDVIALTPGGASKDIVASQTGIPGTSGFKDPLDIVEQPGTGNLYVSEYDQLGSGPKITLLKVNDSTPQPQACSPVSTLPCAAVKVTLPRMLNWSSDHGALLDKDNQGTGFTMVQPSSNGGAFKPELLDMDPATGRFTITTTKGIQYKTATGTPPSSNNNLDNGVGVGVSDAQPLRFETKLAGFPNASGQSEQAGLWFGPGEDDYVKLVVASTGPDAQRVQLMREEDGISESTAPRLDEVNQPLATNIEGSEPIRLRLEVDPITRIARAWYALGSGELQELPGQLTLPADFFDGSEVLDSLEAKGIENFGGIFATHRNSTTAGAGLRFAFEDFGVEQNRGPNRAPVVDAIADRTSVEGEVSDVHPQASDADGDTLTWSATGLPNGLTINPATGVIGGTIASGTARPQPYAVTLTVVDGFGGQASESFDWTVTQETLPTVEQLKVNFQSAAAAIPDGYVRDYGLPYGPRSATDQDGTGRTTPVAQAGLRYGWVVPGSATPLDLSVGGTTPGNGRDRNVALVDQRYDTLMHMQADDVVSSAFNGTPLPGSWELALPDGSYDVTVAAGDPNVSTDPERHALSVEGQPALDFTPSGLAGAETRRKTATVNDVDVTDGRLTLLATGENTKVNFIEIDRSEQNEAPVVEGIADRNDREGANVDFLAAGSDPEHGPLSWSATGLPTGLTIDSDTGRIHGTIASGAARQEPYEVKVTATDNGTPPLKGEVSFEWTVTDGTAPAPVADLAASAGDRRVALSWHNPSDSDLDRVRIVRTIGAASGPADGVEVYEGKAEQATATGLANGTEYTFTAYTRDGAGNWSQGRSVKATPRHLAPTVDPVASRSDRERTNIELQLEGRDPEGGQLTWSATGLPQGLTIDPQTGRIGGTIASGEARPTPYLVTVTATDNGTPPLKGEVSFEWTVTDGTPPAPVADLAASAGDREVSLSWHNPSDADFGFVRIMRTTGAPASGPDDGMQVYQGTAAQATAAGLENGTEYTFTAFTRDAADNWSQGRSVTASPRHLAPTVDPIANRSDREGEQIDLELEGTDPEGDTLRWSASGLPQGLAIDPGTGRISGTIAPGAARQEPYEVTVTATDNGTPQPLEGKASFDWTVTDGTAPGPVTGLAAALGDRQVALSWVNPDDGDFDLVRVVRTTGAPASGPDAGDKVYEGTAAKATAEGLANGTEYTFTAFTRDRAGNWSQGRSVKATPRHLAPTVDPIANRSDREGKLIDLELEGTDPEGDALRWSASGLPDGLAIDPGTGRIHGTITSGTARQAPYRVTVIATDDGTPQPLKGEVSFEWTVTDGTAPGPVTGLQASAGDRRVSLSWVNPDDDFDAVRIVRTTGAPASGPDAEKKVYEGKDNGATVHDLDNGTEYTFTAFARDRAGNWSAPRTVKATPRNLAPTVDPITNRSDREGKLIDLELEGTDPDGGQLRWSATGLPQGLTIDPQTGRIHGTIASGAARQEPYRVTVTATDNGTPQPLEDEASFDWTVTDGTAPGPVTGLQASAGDRQVSLSWVNPDDGDFDLVRIVRTIGAASGPDTGDKVYEGTAAQATAEGLANGTEYTFTAFTRDAAGNWSQARSVKATPRQPAPPVDPNPTQPPPAGNPNPTQPPPAPPAGNPKPSRTRATLRLGPTGPLSRQPVVAVRLRGKLIGATAGRRTIEVECATAGGRWKTVAKTLTTRDGSFGVRVRRLERPVRCRARFAGDRSTQPALSSLRRITSIASAQQAHKR